MKRHNEIDAFILAGGASSRMGRAKSLLEIDGVPLIVRTIQLVESLVNQVIVVGPLALYESLGVRAIHDQNFGMPVQEGETLGPLAGIATALSNTQSRWNLILASDLPYLTPEWLGWLLSRAERSAAQVVLPQTLRGLEPLAAVYRVECAQLVVESLRRGVRKVTEALTPLSLEIVNESEWKDLDPAGTVLNNMNTPAHYEVARVSLEFTPRRQP